MPFFSRTLAAPETPATDPVLLELKERLKSLDGVGLTGLGTGLQAQGGLESYNATRLGWPTGRDGRDRRGVTSEAVALAERAKAVASEGVELTGRISSIAGQTNLLALDGLSSSIGDVSTCIDRISEATVGVATVAADAGAATEQVSASAQQSSAATQQIAASTVELAGPATELDRLVGNFTR